MNIIKKLCMVIFPLITIPYVARVLSVESYGIVNYAYSIISYFILLAALGCPGYAIREGSMLRNDQNRLEDFCNEIFSISIVATILSIIILIVVAYAVPKFQNIRGLLFLFSTVFVLNTFGTDWLNTIFEDFAYITVRYVIFQIISLGMIFLLVRHPEDAFYYALSMVTATCGANILNIFYVRRYVHLKPTMRVHWRRHLKPVLYIFFTTVAGTIYVNSDITILGFMTDDMSTGLYSMVSKIYMVIKELLIAMIAATVPRLSAYLGQNLRAEYDKLIQDLFDVMELVIPPAVVGMFLISKDIITVSAGNKYLAGVGAFRILAIAVLFSAAANFYMNAVLIPFKKEKVCLIGSVVSAVANILLNLILIPHFGYNAAAITTLLSEMIIFGILAYYGNRCVRLTFESRKSISVLLGCIIIAIICILSGNLTNLIIRLITSVIGSLVGYVLVLTLTGHPLVMSFFNGICKR